MKVKINFNDPRFSGLTKKQIKKFSEREASGKNPTLPQPKLTKKLNKKMS